MKIFVKILDDLINVLEKNPRHVAANVGSNKVDELPADKVESPAENTEEVQGSKVSEK